MSAYVALLRAVNLGPYNRVAMSDLRAIVVAAGLAEPRTLLQSGNVVFDDPKRRSAARLEALLEHALEDELGVATAVFVRDARRWEKVVGANPFPDEAKRDPGHLLVTFSRTAPAAASVAALQAAIKGPELVRTGGGELFTYYPDGVGRSRLSAAIVNKHLRGNGTARNWNTVLKLGALLR